MKIPPYPIHRFARPGAVENDAVGLLAPITTSGSEDKTAALFPKDAAQEIDQDAEENAADELMGNKGRRGRKRKGAES